MFRKTQPTLRVAKAILAHADERIWGYPLSKEARVHSGTLYPILWKMLEAGWVRDGWEQQAESNGRPPRRYYVLTKEGREGLADLVRHM